MLIFPAILGALLAAEPWVEKAVLCRLALGIIVLSLLQLTRGYFVARSLHDATLSTLVGLLMSLAFLALFVLFGAPVTALVLETAVAAAHVALLAIPPLVIEYGVSYKVIQKAITARLSRTAASAGASGALIGSWLGVVPVVLDWDRPWQQWPLTLVMGAYVGCMIGHIYGCSFSTKNGHKSHKSADPKTEKQKGSEAR